MTSIQEQLKALKAQEIALKAQLKKANKKTKEELKNLADFKKYVAFHNSRDDFAKIMRFAEDIDYFGNTTLDDFSGWFFGGISRNLPKEEKIAKKTKKINEVCDLLDAGFPEKYSHLRKKWISEVIEEEGEEEN